MGQLIQGITFDKNDFKAQSFPKGEYEKCTFTNCIFSNTDPSEIIFWECTFITCDISLAKLIKTTFRQVAFRDCKMLGLRFDNCNKFGLSFGFEGCILDHSSFYELKLKNIVFRNCRLLETVFTQCDLTSAVFDNCDLSGTTFDNTILEKADLRTACNYAIDPDRNKIKKAKFSIAGISGLLDKYDIYIES